MTPLLVLCAVLAAGPTKAPPKRAKAPKAAPAKATAPGKAIANPPTPPPPPAPEPEKQPAAAQPTPTAVLEPRLSGPGLGTQTRSLAPMPKAGHGGSTACAACHATSSWSEVKFNHERTGFPLTGLHARTTCKACHPTSFEVPVPSTCQGCHRDVHAGELGARCEACHDTTDWRSRFDADAHRRTNFPLLGAHAALPCTECHGEARERRFARATVDCLACHANDAQRTVGTAVDHLSLGFATQSCQGCHRAQAFSPARFPRHDGCFPISAGSHAGVACLSCHDSLGAMTQASGCSTGTANKCVACHNNTGGGGKVGNTDALHGALMGGYSYANFKRCAECHKGTELAP